MHLKERLNEINKNVRKVADDFSSYFGEHNNNYVRLLRLKEKNIISDLIAKSQSNYFNFYRNLNQSALNSLIENGFIEFPEIINSKCAREIKDYFQEINIACNHWVYQPDKELFKISNPEDKLHGTFDPKYIVENEALLKLFLNEGILDLIEGYLGSPGRIFHLNTTCTFSGDYKPPAQNLHRDNSHPKFCVLFLYLSDVSNSNGPHEYYRNTHSVESFEKFYPQLNPNDFFDLSSDSYGRDNFFESNLFAGKKIFTGDAGRCFLTDPRGIHRGIPVLDGTRWMAWARYAPIIDDRRLPKFQLNDYILENLNDRELYTISSILKK